MDNTYFEQHFEQYGCSLIGVPDARYPFTYSIGLQKNFGHPDLFVVGLSPVSGGQVLNSLAHEIKHERVPVEGEPFPNVLNNYPIVLRPLPEKYYSYFLGQLIGFNEAEGTLENMRVMQLFWPDKNCLFPWQDGCDENIAYVQNLEWVDLNE